jgi:mono/diheme cytochrome c family protein
MRAIMLVVAVAAVTGPFTALRSLGPHLPAAERGRRLAEQEGCFGCHGPEGTQGSPNPGRTDGTVPTFTGDVMMYADSPDQIREWIRDGVTAKRAGSETWRRQREQGVLKMPAFKDRLSKSQIEDLVAFVQADAGSPEPDDSTIARGQARAEALGCFGCHGPGGRLARPNRGSFKGYVPSWDGDDFPELVGDRAEFDQWVEHGVSARFERNGLARYFLERATLRMPAYREHLEPGDLDMLWDYVEWMRGAGRIPTATGQEEPR